MIEKSYIQYLDYEPSYAYNFFAQRQNALLLANAKSAFDNNEARLNQILSNAQQGLNKLTNSIVTEENLANAISKGMEASSVLSADLEKMAGSITSYFSEADAKAAQLKNLYESGYDNFEVLVNSVLKSGRVIVNQKELAQILNSLHPDQIQTAFKDMANPLGWIGELSGLPLLSNIADQLLESSFKDIPGVTVEIINTGALYTDKGSRLTTDNLLVFRQDNRVIYQLNLSNKLNTMYQAKSNSTKRAIKLRTTTVNSFLSDHEDWAEHVYNIISYHWDTTKDMRVDYLTGKGNIARQTLGLQILYDHIYGTKENFLVGNDIFKDEVQLIAYGTKIIASKNVLRHALFTKAMNDKKKFTMIAIDRKSWFHSGNEQGKTYIQNEYDAQRKIAAFNLIYKQTLQYEI